MKQKRHIAKYLLGEDTWKKFAVAAVATFLVPFGLLYKQVSTQRIQYEEDLLHLEEFRNQHFVRRQVHDFLKKVKLERLQKYEEPEVQRGSLLALVEDHPPVKKMVVFADCVASKLSQYYEKVTVRSETMTTVLKECTEKRVSQTTVLYGLMTISSICLVALLVKFAMKRRNKALRDCLPEDYNTYPIDYVPPYEEEEQGREKDWVEPIEGNEKEIKEQLQCGCYDEADQVKPNPQRKALQAKIALEQLKRKTKTQKDKILETVKMCQGKAVEGNGSETGAVKESQPNDDGKDQGKSAENVDREHTEKEGNNEGKENKSEHSNSKVKREVAKFKKRVPINPVIRRKQMKIQRRNPRSYAPVI
ncbi:hypothetical protein SK128_025900 [Halocaridina rubra]|uniref:Uncharacterized protein n=1 Tax=Halocaridina rubra TaxID=373956 RepID=A0AAN8XN67_HALRR